MGQPSSDLRHPDLGFDYRKLVNIRSSFQSSIFCSASRRWLKQAQAAYTSTGRILFRPATSEFFFQKTSELLNFSELLKIRAKCEHSFRLKASASTEQKFKIYSILIKTRHVRLT